MDKKIIILIPSSSKNCNFKSLKSSTLIGILYKSLLNFDISKFTFIIGFDDDDQFYINNQEKLKLKLPSNFHLKYLTNYDKSYVCIVNQLAEIAINEFNADYLFLIADDLIFFDFSFVDNFSDYFKDKQIGLGHCKDKKNRKDICTHPFVSANHVKYLGYFYPKEIKNWYCDTWITQLYRNLNLECKTDDFILENQNLEKRYEVYNIDKTLFNELVFTAETILNNSLSK